MVDDLRRQGVCPATVIDVGANAGQFSCAAWRLWRPHCIHAFEPLPDVAELFQRELGRVPGIVIHPVALGAEVGDLPLHVNVHSHSSSLLGLAASHEAAFPDATTAGDLQVPVRTLDGELSDVELPPPVLVKLDVQGYERWVLDGGLETLARAEWVIVESSFKPLYEREPGFLDMVAYMAARGFRFLRPVGWLTAPGTDEILQCDALYGRAEGDAR
jgi:FkbM family methyltransferase